MRRTIWLLFKLQIILPVDHFVYKIELWRMPNTISTAQGDVSK